MSECIEELKSTFIINLSKNQYLHEIVQLDAIEQGQYTIFVLPCFWLIEALEPRPRHPVNKTHVKQLFKNKMNKIYQRSMSNLMKTCSNFLEILIIDIATDIKSINTYRQSRSVSTINCQTYDGYLFCE